MARRSFPLLALALVGATPALAYDDSLPREREPACSALCRSWMGLGQAEAHVTAPADQPATATPPAPTVSAPPTIVVPSAVSVAPSRARPVVKPVARIADKVRHAEGRANSRAVAPAAMPTEAAPAGSPPTLALPRGPAAPPKNTLAVAQAMLVPALPAEIAVASAPSPAVASAPLPVVASAPLPVVASAPAPVVASAPAPVVASAPSPVVASAPSPVVASAPSPVVASAPAPVVASAPAPVVASAPAPVVASAPAPVVASAPAPVAVSAIAPPRPPAEHGTPLNVKLGFYAVLAALVGWGFGQRRPSGDAPAPMPRRRRGSARRAGQGGVQHAAVDAL